MSAIIVSRQFLRTAKQLGVSDATCHSQLDVVLSGAVKPFTASVLILIGSLDLSVSLALAMFGTESTSLGELIIGADLSKHNPSFYK